jgi:hypothetical protein
LRPDRRGNRDDRGERNTTQEMLHVLNLRIEKDRNPRATRWDVDQPAGADPIYNPDRRSDVVRHGTAGRPIPVAT